MERRIFDLFENAPRQKPCLQHPWRNSQWSFLIFLD
jgi:hypothetical protein